MVCIRVAFHKNAGNHEDDDNSEATNKELSAGLAEIMETTEMAKTGVQITDSPNNGFRNTREMP